MNDPLLIDTDVLIDYLRGQSDAVTYLESLPEPPLISVVTVAELYAGVREGLERADLEKLVSALRIIPVSQDISIRGGLFRRDYKGGHNVSLTDALIAATAEILGAKLVTLNRKHFPMLADVIVPYVKA